MPTGKSRVRVPRRRIMTKKRRHRKYLFDFGNYYCVRPVLIISERLSTDGPTGRRRLRQVRFTPLTINKNTRTRSLSTPARWKAKNRFALNSLRTHIGMGKGKRIYSLGEFNHVENATDRDTYGTKTRENGKLSKQISQKNKILFPKKN